MEHCNFDFKREAFHLKMPCTCKNKYFLKQGYKWEVREREEKAYVQIEYAI